VTLSVLRGTPRGSSLQSVPPRLRIALQFLGMGLTWGSSFLFMKVALEGVDFFQVAWARLVLGGATLLIIVLVMRLRFPRERVVWMHFLVIAVTNCIIPHLAFAWAEQYVSSGLASIYNATTPIMTALFATLAFRVEKLTFGQVVGIALGIFGVIVIISPWQYSGLTDGLAGQFACLLAALCYGFSYSYMRRFLSARPIPGPMFAFLNIGVAGAIMLLLTPVIALAPVRLTPWIVASLLALGILGTGLAYIWNINVLRAWGPTAVSTVTYITPVVGVVLGVLILREVFSWNQPVGAVLVLVGILFAQKRIRFGRDKSVAMAQAASFRL
jgi:drug/metabolite transporter (DMT)-like permease